MDEIEIIATFYCIYCRCPDLLARGVGADGEIIHECCECGSYSCQALTDVQNLVYENKHKGN